MRPHPTNPSHTETITARIEWPMNDHDAMTVRVVGSEEVRQLVEFEGESVAKTLAKLPAGASVPLRMESLGTRGNAWRVTELHGAAPEATDASGGDDASHEGHGSEKQYREANERAQV